jgi:putative transcriptional regulator
MDSLRGELIVAAPTLVDPNFWRAVVLVAEHGDEGALGVVLNRPSDVTVADAVPELAETLDGEDVMHVGGPVAPTGVVVLAEWADPAPSAGLVFGAIGLLSAAADVHDLGASAARARAYAGHAGWGPGQLESELEREDWIVADPRPEDVFVTAPETLWGGVLTRKGGRFALLARMPPDPSVN